MSKKKKVEKEELFNLKIRGEALKVLFQIKVDDKEIRNMADVVDYMLRKLGYKIK